MSDPYVPDDSKLYRLNPLTMEQVGEIEQLLRECALEVAPTEQIEVPLVVKTVMTIMEAQLGRGENPPINTTAVLCMWVRELIGDEA